MRPRQILGHVPGRRDRQRGPVRSAAAIDCEMSDTAIGDGHVSRRVRHRRLGRCRACPDRDANCPPETLSRLAADPDERVRASAAGNINAALTADRWLAMRNDDRSRQRRDVPTATAARS